MKTHIVIPIGIGAPGTPVQTYLEQSVESILNQTSEDYILTVAADSNIPDRCKDYLESKGVKIKWFEPFYFYKKGGIFGKIVDAWKDEDSKYVAFLHYDDVWDSEKLKIQVDLMESKSLAGSFSSLMMMDSNGNYNAHDYSFQEISRNTVGTRTMAFAHSCIVNKELLFNSGFLETEDKWNEHYYEAFRIGFEDIWSLFIHKLKYVERAPGAKMFWRTHDMSVSSTFIPGSELVNNLKREADYNSTGDIDVTWGQRFNTILNDVKNTF